MLDASTCREEDGSLSTKVYRKKTHTDQYLAFKSHHPLHHKLGVVRTLLDRSDSIITKPEDREKEEEHVCQALKRCGYPDWSFKRVREQRKLTPEERKQKKGEKGETSKSTKANY